MLDASGLLPGGISNAKKMRLNYRQNVFSFDFEVLHFSDPEKNQSLFKLENYDAAWRQPGPSRRASYFNVPPGHYVFKVKAASANGIWTERNIEVIIDPPWWETWWFRVLSVIALVIVVYAIIKERSRKLKAENILLEEKVTSRTEQLKKSFEELRSTQAQLIQAEKMASLGELTAGIAHEIQNPLNFVNNFSEVNKELIAEMREEIDKGNYDEVKNISNDIEENQEKIIHHGKRADSIVKGMLQHSRVSTGKKKNRQISMLCVMNIYD
jgi:signal transduction histidine kinase